MLRRIRLAAILVAISTNALAHEVIHVTPTGVLTWQDIVRMDQAVADNERERLVVPTPFGRAARNVGDLHTVLNLPTRSELQSQRAPFGSLPRTSCAGCPGETALAYGFQAIVLSGSPPDTMGAVGPNHVMTMLNTKVQIQAKNGIIISTVSRATFWAPLNGGTDPQLIYDAPSARWIATSPASSGGVPGVGVAISATDDPTGTWRFYFLATNPGDFPDFPRFGTNASWIAVTANVNPYDFHGPKMWVIDKATALSGGPLTVTVFPPGFDGNTTGELATLQPCITLDPAEPTLYIVDDDGLDPSDNTNLLRLSHITGTGPSPAWSVVPGSAYPGMGLFRVANVFGLNPLNAVQCDSGERLISDDARLSNASFRNGRIWAVHHGWLPASGTADRAAAFWYQIDPSAMPNPIVQSGVVDGGPGVHHIYPSISANCADDACIGFTRTGAQICPEGAFCTRLVGDALGTMRPVRAIKRGVGTFYVPGGFPPYRWGDYSATVVDPADDRTFWTIQEYVAVPYALPATSSKEGTWWGRITQDCNLNYTPDLCDASIHDCNQNGISDACECCHGDVNGDGVLNAADIRAFAAALVNQPSCAGADFLTFCRADLDRDAVLGISDIPVFAQQLLSPVGCP